MSDFNIFLTDEVKQQLREQEEAEKRVAQLGGYMSMNMPGNMFMTTHNMASVNPAQSPWGQGVTADNLLREAKAILPGIKQDFESIKNGNWRDLKRYGTPSVERAVDLFDEVAAMPISDTEKHAYISCVGAQGGYLSAAQMKALGILKEAIDTYRKSRSPEQRKAYGGLWGILEDSYKDLENNRIGRSYGIDHPEWGACDIFLK